MDTELKLLHWRDGQTKAERLCANILSLDGFSSVDPQCPLGGADGIKDVLCEKNGWKYVGAVYFPTKQNTFRTIKKKFTGDFAGVVKNEAHGIAFLTNQKMSPGERKTLLLTAEAKGRKAIIYHCERIREILDSPIGFGHRLEYLGIEMTREDQLSFFCQWGGLFEDMLKKQSDYIIGEISERIATASPETARLTGMIERLYARTLCTASDLIERQPPSDKASLLVPLSAPTSDQLNVDLLCMLHRAICFDHAHSKKMGELREAKTWIGSPGCSPETARYIPPPPDKVRHLTEKLLHDWRAQYSTLQESDDKNAIIDAIVRFHHQFLSVHPFLDGNGRMSRFLLMQQASELLDCDRRVILEDRAPYLEALQRAHEGEFAPLKRVLTQALFGEEEITDRQEN